MTARSAPFPKIAKNEKVIEFVLSFTRECNVLNKLAPVSRLVYFVRLVNRLVLVYKRFRLQIEVEDG